MDKELVHYYEECVRTATHHVKEAQDAVAWWQARLAVVEADMENARARLREAQEAGEEATP